MAWAGKQHPGRREAGRTKLLRMKVSKRRTVGGACEKVSESQEQNHGHFYVNEDDNVRAYLTETCSWLSLWILLHGKNVLAYILICMVVLCFILCMYMYIYIL